MIFDIALTIAGLCVGVLGLWVVFLKPVPNVKVTVSLTSKGRHPSNYEIDPSEMTDKELGEIISILRPYPYARAASEAPSELDR